MMGFWKLGEERPARRELMVGSSGIPQTDFVRAIVRPRAGEPADEVIGEAFVHAFAIARTPEDCLEKAALYREAGVAELALHFVGDDPVCDIELLGAALRLRAGA